jgi:hypothetical protein
MYRVRLLATASEAAAAPALALDVDATIRGAAHTRMDTRASGSNVVC